MPATKERSAHFKIVQKLQLDYAPVTATQYESTRTGMRVAVVDQVGPMVNGSFALATEIHDDSGAPHTLEHLCFMGSKSYQYKGLLDKLAARAYSMTNAYTATECTVYTLDTAGWAGFAQILPVYLEHVIVPTLTDAGCYTEVHHVDGAGHDAGVVYSEMQGVQNTQGELMELSARRLIYPEGNGFRYETGGMMEQLRVLTADRIRQFHKEMYQPKNLCLVLTGEVNHNELLRILDDFEDTIIDDVPAIDAPFKRPWVESKPTPPLAKTTIQTIKFPEEDESMGEILAAFIGPGCNDHLSCEALGILLLYLCGSSICVLDNTLVEKEHLCSAICYYIENRPNVVIWFTLNAVETGRLAEVEQRLIGLLKDTATNKLDMSYMHECIKRSRRQVKMKCENASNFFVPPIIGDHLFGHRDGRNLKEIETLRELDMLEGWSEAQWRDFLSKYLVDAHHVSILGEPSQELSEKISRDEQERVKSQQEKLGEEGLKKKTGKLKQAQDENNRPIPDSVIESFPVPSAESVNFIKTTTAHGGTARRRETPNHNVIQDIINKDDDGSPLFFHFEHIPSNFVRIKLDLCTATVPLELKPLLCLYMLNFFKTPVMQDGKRIEFEDLVLDLEKETVGYGVKSERANSELLRVVLETEPENYESVISWLRSLLFDSVHDKERLYSSLTKILAEIPDEKRDGSQMTWSVNTMIHFKRESSTRARDTLSKSVYFKRMKKLLKKDEGAVIAQFAKLCDALHRPENFRLFISADLERLPNPVSSWKALALSLDTSKPLEPIVDRRALLSDTGTSPGSSAYIIPMSTIDSSFGLLIGKGPDTYSHPDFPALLVAIAYMDAVEGPLWVAVRGTGLAYGTGFTHWANIGLLMFAISRSPDCYKAFTVAKEQVEGYATGKFALTKFALEGAISEIVLGMASEQSTMTSAAEESFANQVIRGISKDWSHQMLAKVQAVKPEDIREAMMKYMVPLFRPESSNLIITCAKIMKDKLEKDFASYKPEVATLGSFQDDYGLAAVGDDDDDDDESEDDEDEPMNVPESDEED